MQVMICPMGSAFGRRTASRSTSRARMPKPISPWFEPRGVGGREVQTQAPAPRCPVQHLSVRVHGEAVTDDVRVASRSGPVAALEEARKVLCSFLSTQRPAISPEALCRPSAPATGLRI